MKRKQQHLLRSLAAALLVGAGLVSCSQDDTPAHPGELPPGKYPLELTANLQVTASTRATVDGNWDGIDRSLSAAIKIGDDFISGKGLLQYDVTPSDDNMSVTLTPTKNMDVVYWNSPTETKMVTAIYPFDYPDTPLVREVMTNQSKEEDYQASDYLSGQIYDLTLEKQLKGEANLKFYHQVAKMVVNINKGALISSADAIASVEIGDKDNFFCQGRYVPPTSKDKGDNGTWTFVTGTLSYEKSAITAYKLPSPTKEEFAASYTALVIPQTVKNGNPLIAITLKSGVTFYYRPNSDIELKSGMIHTYDITVKPEGLQVSVSNGIAWGTDGAEGSGSVDLDTFVLNDNSDREFQLSNGDEITVKGNGTQTRGSLTFDVPSGATATVNLKETNISIPLETNDGRDINNITVTGGGTVVFNLIGENTFSLNGLFNPDADLASVTNGIYADGSNIKIVGEGSLHITGQGGSGICASRKNGVGGNIIIENTTIELKYMGCYSWKYHAFIGSKQNETCGNIDITKSNITLDVKTTGYAWPYSKYPDMVRCPALIGCGHHGSCGSITITLPADQQNKSDFLGKLKQDNVIYSGASDRVVKDEDKVGKGPTGTSCGTVTWKASNGSTLETIPAVP